MTYGPSAPGGLSGELGKSGEIQGVRHGRSVLSRHLSLIFDRVVFSPGKILVAQFSGNIRFGRSSVSLQVSMARKEVNDNFP